MSRYIAAAPLALALLLAGCGQHVAQLAVTAPAAPVAAAVQHEEVAIAADAGRLEVRVAGLGTGYRVQATVDQVKFIRVTLSGGALTAPTSKEVVAGPAGTVAFSAVPAGTVNVKIEALDASGLRLGLKETTSAVAKGQTAVLAATLKLDATHVVGEVGALEVDLKVENGEVVTDPVVPASPRPSSPVFSPVPSPVPTVEPGVRTVTEPKFTWYADGTMAVDASVKNFFATAKPVTVKVDFSSRGLTGWKVVETKTVAVGTLGSLATKAFSVRSTKKVSSLFSDGKATVTVTAD
jgi:hypothetical protein